VPVRVRDTVEAALLLVRPQAEAGGVSLVDDAETGTWLLGDPLRVRQVVLNLLSNAVKFTPAGGTVRVSTASYEDRVEIRVEDTGIGIEAEDLTRIFDEFTQISHGTDRAYEGTGLGLPLVRRLVQAMGGGVRAESTAGVGSVFTLWLPTAQGPEGANAATQAPAARTTGDGVRAPVLVVDDDRLVRELCAQVLGDAGYDVRAVPGLKAAREAIAARPPRVILLDLLLEDEYGDGLFQALASLEPRPRVVVMSIVDSGRRTLPGPVDAWLVKPVRPEQLCQAVASAIARPDAEEVAADA
jgi:CheY-like chemotaxis protein/anti-sigma regulatory factor (Ser/Thr protein kinase)